MYVHLPLYAPARFLRESRNGRYGAAVDCIDWAPAPSPTCSQGLGLRDDTLVMFTSDNGSRARAAAATGRGAGPRGTTWEGGQRVPCIMRWPNGIDPGEVCAQITTSLDLLPTFLGLAGGAVPEGLVVDGVDIAPLFTGDTPPSDTPRTFAYFHNDSLEARPGGAVEAAPAQGRQADPRALPPDRRPRGDPQPVCRAAGHRGRAVPDRDGYRADLGDCAEGIDGSGCRPVGRVEDPRPLTEYDPAHPYIEAMYDLPYWG